MSVFIDFLLALTPQSSSGVTSKPANGPAPWTPCFTLPTGGLPTPFLRRPMPVLQNCSPVLPFLLRKVSFENQVAPFRAARRVYHELANLFHQLAPRRISIESSHDFSSL